MAEYLNLKLITFYIYSLIGFYNSLIFKQVKSIIYIYIYKPMGKYFFGKYNRYDLWHLT